MIVLVALLFLLLQLFLDNCTFVQSSLSLSTVLALTTITTPNANKRAFLDSLSVTDELNSASSVRTELLQRLCDEDSNTSTCGGSSSGRVEAFSQVVSATRQDEWRVVYAPHMDFMGKLVRGRFAPVIYKLKINGESDSNSSSSNIGTIVSHARVQLPLIGAWWLSVSGTFGYDQRDDDDVVVCRVDFNEAWVRRIDNDDEPCYYPNVDAVPDDSLYFKEMIRQVGRALFIDQFAVFPVSYLDGDLVVFDFELLGTRICALKQQQQT